MADPVYGGDSTMIVLSDHTQIHLIGVSVSSIQTGTTHGDRHQLHHGLICAAQLMD